MISIEDAFELHDIQRKTLDRLVTMKSSVIALMPGLGKTRLILEHARLHFIEGERNIFVIPKSARAAFTKELSGRNSLFIDASNRNQISLLELSKCDFLVVESSIVGDLQDKVELYCTQFPVNLYVDEAHSLQSDKSSYTQIMWGIRLKCKGTFLVTASPLLNSIQGLFNLYHFAYPTVFKRWSTFSQRYCVFKDREIFIRGRRSVIHEVVGYKNVEELNEILDKLTLKGKIDYNVNYEFISVSLDESRVSFYQKASKGLLNYDGPDDGKEFATRLHDLQRIVDGCAFGEVPECMTSKIRKCCQLIREINDHGQSCLIYFEYLDSLELVHRILEHNKSKLGISRISVLTGAQKEEERVKIEQNIKEAEVVLMSQAGRMSRNLQRSNNLIIFNIPFSVGDILQLTGRICRVDTTWSQQNIYFLSTSQTIDNYKMVLFKDHLALIDRLLGDDCRGTLTCPYVEINREHLSALKHSTLWRM